MITESEYNELRAKQLPACYTFDHQGKAYTPSGIAPTDRLTNEQTSAMEVYEFCADPPDRYFCYVSLNNIPGSVGWGKVTTWIGETLGMITYLGSSYRSNFGDKRRSIRVKAINGFTYAGTYYCGAGDYCRIKRVKDN